MLAQELSALDPRPASLQWKAEVGRHRILDSLLNEGAYIVKLLVRSIGGFGFMCSVV